MAASTAQGIVDPTKPGKYPVILSDALLGKPSKEAYTGIQYNHKPALSSDTAPATARLKQAPRDDSFNIGFADDGGTYRYNGPRTSGDGQYVLLFDPARQAFVLHRLDSLFHMNLTRTPSNTDPESLRKEFPHLQVPQTTTAKGKAKPASASSNASALRKPKDAAARKPVKEKTVSLALPDPPKPAPAPAPTSTPPKRRDRPPEPESDQDDDDDDGGLTIEYPGGEPPSTDFSPAFPAQITRRFSDYVRDGGADEDADADAEPDTGAGQGTGYGEEEEEDDDEEDGEGEEDDQEAFKLPSPVNHHRRQQGEQGLGIQQYEVQPASYANDADADADLEADLEAELEREFEKVSGEMDMDSESSVSEED